MVDVPTEDDIEALFRDLQDREKFNELIGYEDRWMEEEDFVARAKASVPDHPRIKVQVHVPLRRTPYRYVCLNIVGFGQPERDEASHWKVDLLKLKPAPGSVGWDFDDPVAKFTLEDEELDRLARVLALHGNLTEAGEYILVPEGSNPESAKLIAGLLEETDLDLDALADVVDSLAGHRDLAKAIASIDDDAKTLSLAAAANVAHRVRALEQLKTLIVDRADEADFQRLLDSNWWMFGGRYVASIDRRDFTTDEQLDITLIRADGFPEVIELKKPGDGLFKRLRSTEPPKYGLSGTVNDAVNQAAHYISELEANRPRIEQKYKLDFFRPRAKVVIGTLEDDEDDYDEKKLCLRQYNNHLHGIEVLTYTEIVARAERLVELDKTLAASTAEGDSEVVADDASA